MYVKTAVILAGFTLSYTLLVFAVDTWLLALPLAIVLGLITAMIGFNIMHDGGHGAYSRNARINRIMATSLDLIGGSSYMWHWKHGVLHHTYPNVSEHDVDLEVGVFGRMAPYQRLRAHQRWQHWYMWVLYGVLAMKWHLYDDFRDFIAGRIGPFEVARPRGKDLAVFVGGKLTFFSLAFALPMLIHPFWVVLTFYAITTFVLGIVLSMVFQLAHCVEDAEFTETKPGMEQMPRPWAVHQVETTVDFLRHNRLATWLLGGLNFQIEHHLFPRICHVNYPALSRVVEQTCQDHNIRYNVHPSLWAGIASHARWLRTMGLPEGAA